MASNVSYKTLVIAVVLSVILSTGIIMTVPQVQDAIRGPQGIQGIQGIQGLQGASACFDLAGETISNVYQINSGPGTSQPFRLYGRSSNLFVADFDNNSPVSSFNWYINGEANKYMKMTLTEEGNLGIGTTSPSEKLEVDGSVKLSGTGNGIIFPDGTVQSTASIFSGVDWSSTIPCFSGVETRSTSYSTVIDVRGSGYLMSILQNHKSTVEYTGYLKIVIDGHIIYNGEFSTCRCFTLGDESYSISSPGMLSGLFRFTRSLEVFHRSSDDGPIIRTIGAWVND